jgi:hypothetical protein
MKVKELKELLQDVDDELEVQYTFAHTCGFQPNNINSAWHGKYYIKDGKYHEVNNLFPHDDYKEWVNGERGNGEGYPIKRNFYITVER